ncbi:MAG TPA: DNA-3-methyladenine glycosylase I [Candidatus Limnocylindria bacterium]|nr:DNA-3-methyladenine glycosylase I [Candidatus Limnocylindria bacterium]
MSKLQRCAWVRPDPLYEAYHDEEWGVPVHDDRVLFEMLNLEGAQAGLSWYIVLKKRDSYRAAFDGFDPEKIVRYNPRKIESLLQNEGIVRNRLKVEATISNARAYLALREKGTTLDGFLWSLAGGKPLQNRWTAMGQVPAKTPVSDAMSKALKAQGFKFIGTTICYAFMQAVGMVNDHFVDCPRHEAVRKLR